jgi:hypothetical protein
MLKIGLLTGFFVDIPTKNVTTSTKFAMEELLSPCFGPFFTMKMA